jgi:hypothetical protein
MTDRPRAGETIRSLLRVSERLNSTPDVDALLDALVQEATALVDAEGGAAGLNTPEGMACKRYFQWTTAGTRCTGGPAGRSSTRPRT